MVFGVFREASVKIKKWQNKKAKIKIKNMK